MGKGGSGNWSMYLTTENGQKIVIYIHVYMCTVCHTNTYITLWYTRTLLACLVPPDILYITYLVMSTAVHSGHHSL